MVKFLWTKDNEDLKEHLVDWNFVFCHREEVGLIGLPGSSYYSAFCVLGTIISNRGTRTQTPCAFYTGSVLHTRFRSAYPIT